MFYNAPTQTAYLNVPAGNSVLRITNMQSHADDFYTSAEYNLTGFAEARHHLQYSTAHGHNLPNVILIDQPLRLNELRNFVKWLNGVPALRCIPVVYNSARLQTNEKQENRLMKLVDDTIDLDKNYDILVAKAAFLKKAKQRQYMHSVPTLQTAKTSARVARRKMDRGVRRLMDIIFSATILLLLSPLFLLIGLLIKLESGGSVFYISKRAGKGYKIFDFYKFRTMTADAEFKLAELVTMNQYGAEAGAVNFFKIENDPRVTRIGALLRNTSLDELPQLLNVLKGDMSLVGNRPLPLYEASTLTTNDWAMRFMAPAGITGLWQIEKRGNADMSVVERINLDINYARNNGLLQDLRIILRTPTAMFQKTNV